jgi:hypothetical protein
MWVDLLMHTWAAGYDTIVQCVSAREIVQRGVVVQTVEASWLCLSHALVKIGHIIKGQRSDSKSSSTERAPCLGKLSYLPSVPSHKPPTGPRARRQQSQGP